jgi:glycosyltransferase involved in cell wall biosynthesis
MRILWLSHFVPYPPKGGPFQRSYNLLREVSRHNDVYLLAMRHKKSTHPVGESQKAKQELGSFCTEIHVEDISSRTSPWEMYTIALKTLFSKYPFNVEVFKSEGFRKHLKELLTKVKFDVIHFDTIGLAYYLQDSGLTPKVLNHHDIESFRMRRRIGNEKNPLRKLYLVLEASKLALFERKNCHLFNMNIAVSELDKDRLQDIAPDSSVEIVANGVDTDYFEMLYEPDRQDSLIFAGRLDQFANREGIMFFCSKVWPLITNETKHLKFQIIGANPPKKLVDISNHDDRIELLGYVDDVRPYFAKATVCVCPIYDGGGTRIKILDALAMGMPIISTTIGCEGIDVTPEKDILIADTPDDFARQIMRTLDDRTLTMRLSNNARKTAVEIYSWKVIGQKLNKLYSSLEAK